MTTPRRHSSPVQRQLEAYEESWQREHRDAMACRDLEDTIAVGVGLGRVLLRLDDNWRDRVFRGTEEYTPEYDRLLQGFFRIWLQVTEDILRCVPPFEERFGAVSGADEARECTAKVTELLASWQPPHLARAVGSREMILTPEAAADLDRVIQQARDNPPPMPTRHLETRDPSFLK